MSLTGNINFSGLLNGDVDCGQGSNVIPNPSGTATADLYKLQIDETIYNIEGSGGTEVIPNPSGTATDDLTKLQINDTIYQIEGEQGPAGYSPEVTIDTITGGHSVTITDEEHPSGQTFNVMDGIDGTDGTNGTSAYATVSKSGNTATIICTDANGTTTAQISDGTDGTNGTDGTDGTSAYATVSKSGNTATITCTDANGTTTAQISDGTDGTNGTDGTDGTSAYATVSKSGNTATITCTDANGTTTATVSDGTNGQGVPSGGTSGQYLKKDSSTDYDTSFANIQASEVSYDNTSSGMTATSSQGAIDELNSSLTELQNSYQVWHDAKSVSANTVTTLKTFNVTKGVWLIVGYTLLSGSQSGTYNTYLNNSLSLRNRTVRNAGTGGGGTNIVGIWNFSSDCTVSLEVYLGTATTVTGSLEAIRLSDLPSI